MVNQGQNDFFNLMRKASLGCGAAAIAISNGIVGATYRADQCRHRLADMQCRDEGGRLLRHGRRLHLRVFVHDALRGLLPLMEPGGFTRHFRRNEMEVI